MALIGEDDEEILCILEFTEEQFNLIEQARALTGETLEEYMNRAIQQGLDAAKEGGQDA